MSIFGSGVVAIVVLALGMGIGQVGVLIAGEQKAGPAEGKAHVEKVVDGDTLRVRMPGGKEETVQILGINCPESRESKKCLWDGKAAQEACQLKDKRQCNAMKEGKSVILGKDCDWQIPRGLEASRKAAELLGKKTVTLECDGECKRGGFGHRHLRYVRMEDGRDFGLVMVQEGYCEDFGWNNPHPRGKAYRSVMDAARKKGKGLFAP
jgi:endonuclease YncB( thermonuclease family)